MKRALLAPAFAIVTLALPCATVRADVIVVDDDGGPGVDHTSFSDALAAAQSGDTLLMKDGVYGGGFALFAVSAMSLEIVADAGADVRLRAPLRVQDLEPQHVVRIRGLTVEQVGFIVEFGPPLNVQNCAGSVWVEDSTIIGPLNPLKSDGTPVSVFNSAAVTFSRCQILAGNTSGSGAPAPKGLQTASSNVYVFESTIQGGAGLDGATTGVFATEGGDGVRVSGGLFYAQRSSFTGGPGGDGADGLFGCTDGEAGGNGITLVTADSVVRLLNCTVAGGPGGGAPPAPCVGVAGAAGVDVDDAVGSFFEFAGSGYSLCVEGPVREGEGLDIAIGGDPGDLLWLWITLGPAPVFLPPYKSPFLLDPSFFTVIPLGAIPPGGRLAFSPTIGELGPGVEIVSLYLQIAGVSATHGPIAGTGQAVSLLDVSF